MAADLVVVSRQSVAAVSTVSTVSLRYGRSCHVDGAPLLFLHNVTVLTLDYNINLVTSGLRLGPKASPARRPRGLIDGVSTPARRPQAITGGRVLGHVFIVSRRRWGVGGESSGGAEKSSV